jgi:hypothetical protein
MKGKVAQVKEETPKKPAAKSSMEARKTPGDLNPMLIELETAKEIFKEVFHSSPF